MSNRKTLRNIALYIGIPLLLILIVTMFVRNQSTETIRYSEIIGYFERGEVKSFDLDLGSGECLIALRDETKPLVRYSAPNVALFLEDIRPLVQEYNKNNSNSQITYNYKAPADTSWLTSMLPYLILIIGMGLLYFFMFRRLSGTMGDAGKQMNFGKAKIKQMSDEKRKTTFADVAGADEEKEELREIVEFLKNPKKYNELGARIPKGVLLVARTSTPSVPPYRRSKSKRSM